MKNQDTDPQLECLSNQRQIDTEFNSIPSGYKKGPLWIKLRERKPRIGYPNYVLVKHGEDAFTAMLQLHEGELYWDVYGCGYICVSEKRKEKIIKPTLNKR